MLVTWHFIPCCKVFVHCLWDFVDKPLGIVSPLIIFSLLYKCYLGELTTSWFLHVLHHKCTQHLTKSLLRYSARSMPDKLQLNGAKRLIFCICDNVVWHLLTRLIYCLHYAPELLCIQDGLYSSQVVQEIILRSLKSRSLRLFFGRHRTELSKANCNWTSKCEETKFPVVVQKEMFRRIFWDCVHCAYSLRR